jgi:hypothetical protein
MSVHTFKEVKIVDEDEGLSFRVGQNYISRNFVDITCADKDTAGFFGFSHLTIGRELAKQLGGALLEITTDVV